MANITLVSWNINGIRAAEKKDFRQWLEKGEFEIVAVQETKVHHPDILSPSLLAPDGYASYWACPQINQLVLKYLLFKGVSCLIEVPVQVKDEAF